MPQKFHVSDMHPSGVETQQILRLLKDTKHGTTSDHDVPLPCLEVARTVPTSTTHPSSVRTIMVSVRHPQQFSNATWPYPNMCVWKLTISCFVT